MAGTASATKNIYQVSPEGYLEFSPAFFEQCMREYLADATLSVSAVRYLGEVGVTATTRMKYSGEKDKLVGLFHYELRYTSGGAARTIQLLVKSKTHYLELCERLAGVLEKSGVALPELAARLAETELYNTHMKEIQVFRMQRSDPPFRKILPAVYGTYVDDSTRQYMVLEEFLAGAYVMKDYTDISFWDHEVTTEAVRDFSGMHAAYYGKHDSLVAQGWLGGTMDAARMQRLAPLWRAYLDVMRAYVNRLFDQQHFDQHLRWIETIPEWWGKIDTMKKTLIFNDAQIRNVAVRAPGTDPHLVLFDWECAAIQLPQRDLVEFLSYTISEKTTSAEIDALIEAARVQLETSSGQKVDARTWWQGCEYSVYDFHVNRMACQLVLHLTLNRPDIERVFRASLRILERTQAHA